MFGYYKILTDFIVRFVKVKVKLLKCELVVEMAMSMSEVVHW